MKFNVTWFAGLLLASLSTLHAADKTAPKHVGPPRPEHSVTNRAFQGIPSMAVAPRGRLWGAWYAGVTPGEDKNNYVVLTTSGDGGMTWKEVLTIDPDGDGPVRAFDPELWVAPDGRLFFFWAQMDKGQRDAELGVWCIETTEPEAAQPKWSEPRRIGDGVMMCKPLTLSTGEWVLPISKWREHDNSAQMVVSTDKGKTWAVRGACNVPVEVRVFDEHMFVERRDGSLWLLARTKYGIGESVSTDGGKTWPELKPSAIPHTSSRFFIRRLESGHLLLVKHGPFDKKTGRSHLLAFVSKDDGKTWGGGLMLDERAGVSYPDGQQTPDGLIRIIYDFSRTGERNILLATFREEDAAAGKETSKDVRLRQVVSKASGGKEKKAVPAREVKTGFAGERKPNVLVILADDLGFADLGFTGNKQIKTPHLDALAASGITCRNAYVSAPYCSPTRAGLLTGRYQTRFGHEFNPRPGNWDISSPGLPTTEATFIASLRAAGYRTGLVGKWHLGEADNQHPLARGFDEFYGFLGGENHYLAGREKPLTILRGKENVKESEYLTDALGREAAAFVERNKDRPWFLYLAFNAVHLPQEATQRDLQRVPKLDDRRRQTYLAMLAAMDDAVGTVMDRLRQTGQEENTLIIFLNDNGGPTAPINPNVNGSINFPFRGGKRQLLEGGLRVPFVVAWAGTLPKAKTFDGLVSSLDVAPTVLAAARAPVKSADRFDGVDLLPYLSGRKLGDPHQALFWRFGRQFAVRQGEWKLACWKEDTGAKFTTALYNLKSDPGEKTDVAAAHPEMVRSLQAAWNEWNRSNVRPLFGDKIEMEETRTAPWTK